MKKVATTRLKHHTYGEVLTNDDVLERLKEAKEKKNKAPKRKKSGKKAEDVENQRKKTNPLQEIDSEDEMSDHPCELSDNKNDVEDIIHEMENGEVGDITYLEPSVDQLVPSVFILVDLTGGPRNRTHFAYVCRVDEVTNDELAVSGMKSVDRNRTEFVFVQGDEFTVAKSQVKAILPSPTAKRSGRRDVYMFGGSVNVKER